MRSSLCVAASLVAISAALTVCQEASADPVAWAGVGAGALGWRQGADAAFRVDPMLLFEGGVGTSPDNPVIGGFVFRVTPLLATATGADMAWLARVMNRGYQVGGIGLAADLGVYARTWGLQTSQGFAGSLSLGLPYGVTISGHALVGSADTLAFGGTLSLDVLRLLLYRQTGLNWWPNPEVRTKALPQATGPSRMTWSF